MPPPYIGSRRSGVPSSRSAWCRPRLCASRSASSISDPLRGIEVRPGDYVCGDSDGVVVVPAELHDKILSRIDGR
jgi:hypothetical protein